MSPSLEHLEDELSFERLVAQCAVACLDLPDEGELAAIRPVLGRVGEWLSVDRASCFRVSADVTLSEAVEWVAPGIPTVEDQRQAGAAYPWPIDEISEGRTLGFARPDELSEERRAAFEALGIQSAAYMPILVDDRVAGGLGFETVRSTHAWPSEVIERLRMVADVFGRVLGRIERHEAMRTASAGTWRAKDQFRGEDVYVRREERDWLDPARIVGESPAVLRVIAQIRQVAATDSTVLLLGETGTGKELFATQIHELSARRSRAMVRVNCGAIPATLIESELFGREKGAFTGALARQIGRFELADHSTIFLDEIGDLPGELQLKLLRVIEERTIERLGSPRPITVDTRIVAATHRDLERLVRDNLFREDLYYRLNVFPIHVPPLRERAEDIPLLVWRLVEGFSKSFGKRVDSIDKASLATLQRYHWPGNVRELRNTVERAMILNTDRRLTIPLPHPQEIPPRRSTKLRDVEREHILGVLENVRWRIRGAGGAADRLGLKPTTLESRILKLGLRRPKPA